MRRFATQSLVDIGARKNDLCRERLSDHMLAVLRRCAMGYVKTAMLLALMTALVGAAGLLLAGEAGLLIALVIAAGMNLFAFWRSD